MSFNIRWTHLECIGGIKIFSGIRYHNRHQPNQLRDPIFRMETQSSIILDGISIHHKYGVTQRQNSLISAGGKYFHPPALISPNALALSFNICQIDKSIVFLYTLAA